MKRILALDLGTRRIGLAVSDAMGWTAQGLPTLLRRNTRMDLENLARIAAEKEVGTILLGDPKRMSGEAGRQSEWVREFGARLERVLSVPVIYWDERLTSREAERNLRGSGLTGGERKEAIDRLSAVILLQSFLDARSSGERQQMPDAGGEPLA